MRELLSANPLGQTVSGDQDIVVTQLLRKCLGAFGDGRRGISIRMKVLAEQAVPVGAEAEAVMPLGWHSRMHWDDRKLSDLSSPYLAP